MERDTEILFRIQGLWILDFGFSYAGTERKQGTRFRNLEIYRIADEPAFDPEPLKDQRLFNEPRSGDEAPSRQIARLILAAEREHTLPAHTRAKIQNLKSTI